MNAIQVGQVVISLAGRDKGEYYVVVDVKDNMAHVANGRNRKLDHLKVKKFKHLQPTNMIDNDIANKVKQHLKIANMDIRKVITEYTETGTENTEG